MGARSSVARSLPSPPTWDIARAASKPVISRAVNDAANLVYYDGTKW